MIATLWQQGRALYARLASGPDWTTWVMHGAIGAAYGYAGAPGCATLFYGIRELEQLAGNDDLKTKGLDHLMDWLAPTLAGFATAFLKAWLRR